MRRSRHHRFRPGALILVVVAGLAPLGAGSHASAQETPDGYDAGAAYPGNLPFFYDIYTFRGEGGRTAVVAAFAVPAGELRADRVDDGVRYRFDVTLVLADTLQRTVTRTDDSVYVALPGRLRRDHLLYTQVEVDAPPSRHIQQRVVLVEANIPGVGQLYHSPFPIRDYRGSGLMLSDIALGNPIADEDAWRRGDVTLALLPTTQFPSSSFNVYYEIYNLPRGHQYTTEIHVEALDPERAGQDPIGLRFTEEAAPAAGGMIQELRFVQSSLDRGRYRLTVTVTDEETGDMVRRSREFHVRGWERGATLVPAHPWKTPSR